MRYLRFILGVCALSVIMKTVAFAETPENAARRAAAYIEHCGNWGLSHSLFDKFGKSGDFQDSYSFHDTANWDTSDDGNTDKHKVIDCDRLEILVSELLEQETTASSLSWVSAPQCTDPSYRHNCEDTVTYANGKKYVGAFKDNKRSGQGTFTYANGHQYVGVFKNHKMFPGLNFSCPMGTN